MDNLSAVDTPDGKNVREPWALRDLPSFPAVATKVLQMLSKDDVPIQRIVDLIRTDPAFSAGILRVANSALFGLVAKVETVRHAITVLGLDRVRNLTLTVALGAYLQAGLKIAILRRCWRHCLACALLAEELAEVCSMAADQAYTAGLLHDAGRLGLLVRYPVEYSNVLAVTEENSFDILDTERQLFDIDHCEAGRYLMTLWKFPAELAEVAGRHHEEPSTAQFDMLAVVSLACRLADTLGFEVVKPQRPWTIQEIKAALPQGAQYRFDQDPETLRNKVSQVIDSLD